MSEREKGDGRRMQGERYCEKKLLGVDCEREEREQREERTKRGMTRKRRGEGRGGGQRMRKKRRG